MKCNARGECIKLFIWSIMAQKRLSVNTKEAYEHDLRLFVNFYNQYIDKHSKNSGQKKETVKSYNLLQDFYLFIKQSEDVSDATIARRMSTVVQFMKFCLQENRKEFDLALFDTTNKPNIKLKQQYSSFLESAHLQQLRAVLAESKSDIRISAIIEILYSTGLRISELLALKASCVVEINEKRMLLVIGKGGHQRYVFFNTQAIEKLNLYCKIFEVASHGYLFFSKPGRALTRQRIFQLLKELANRAGVDPDVVFPHSFRHRMLTDLVQGSADLISVQKIAGHKQINTTARYTHVEQELYNNVVKHHPLGKM